MKSNLFEYRMALSFLSQNSGLLDLQSIFDPQYSLQQQQQQLHLPSQQLQQTSRTLTKFDLNIFNDFDQMEFNNNLSRNHNQYQNNINNNTINNNNNSNHNNNNTNNNNIHTHQNNGENLNQVSSKRI